MTDHLADLGDEIRRIPDTLATLSGDPAHCRGYVEDLAQRVERLAADPVEVDASTELTASFGLEPDQEIRSHALDYALQLMARAAIPFLRNDVLALADEFAAYIRSGERPA